MPASKRRLMLFDIDGTLITSGGAGEGALMDAMKQRFGIQDDLSGITIAGATDALIARMMLEKNRLPASPENITALLDAYLSFLGQRLARHAGCVLPGIVVLLDRLRQREDCVLALLTGNLVRGAEIKLSHYSVWDYFEFGAFADDHHDRNELRNSRALAHWRHTGRIFHQNAFLSSGTRRATSNAGRRSGPKPSPSPRETIPAQTLRSTNRISYLMICRIPTRLSQFFSIPRTGRL